MKQPVMRNKLIEAFNNNPHASTAKIAKRLGCSPAYAYQVRSDMSQPVDYERVEAPLVDDSKDYSWIGLIVSCLSGIMIGYYIL